MDSFQFRVLHSILIQIRTQILGNTEKTKFFYSSYFGASACFVVNLKHVYVLLFKNEKKKNWVASLNVLYPYIHVYDLFFEGTRIMN